MDSLFTPLFSLLFHISFPLTTLPLICSSSFTPCLQLLHIFPYITIDLPFESFKQWISLYIDKDIVYIFRRGIIISLVQTIELIFELYFFHNISADTFYGLSYIRKGQRRMSLETPVTQQVYHMREVWLKESKAFVFSNPITFSYMCVSFYERAIRRKDYIYRNLCSYRKEYKEK